MKGPRRRIRIRAGTGEIASRDEGRGTGPARSAASRPNPAAHLADDGSVAAEASEPANGGARNGSDRPSVDDLREALEQLLDAESELDDPEADASAPTEAVPASDASAAAGHSDENEPGSEPFAYGANLQPAPERGAADEPDALEPSDADDTRGETDWPENRDAALPDAAAAGRDRQPGPGVTGRAKAHDAADAPDTDATLKPARGDRRWQTRHTSAGRPGRRVEPAAGPQGRHVDGSPAREDEHRAGLNGRVATMELASFDYARVAGPAAQHSELFPRRSSVGEHPPAHSAPPFTGYNDDGGDTGEPGAEPESRTYTALEPDPLRSETSKSTPPVTPDVEDGAHTASGRQTHDGYAETGGGLDEPAGPDTNRREAAAGAPAESPSDNDASDENEVHDNLLALIEKAGKSGPENGEAREAVPGWGEVETDAEPAGSGTSAAQAAGQAGPRRDPADYGVEYDPLAKGLRLPMPGGEAPADEHQHTPSSSLEAAREAARPTSLGANEQEESLRNWLENPPALNDGGGSRTRTRMVLVAGLIGLVGVGAGLAYVFLMTGQDGATSATASLQGRGVQATAPGASLQEAAPVIEASNTFGRGGSPIQLPVQARNLDAATASFLHLSGMPGEARLSAGFQLSDGSWLVQSSQAKDLSVTLPRSFAGQIGVTAQLLANDASTPLSQPARFNLVVQPASEGADDNVDEAADATGLQASISGITTTGGSAIEAEAGSLAEAAGDGQPKPAAETAGEAGTGAVELAAASSESTDENGDATARAGTAGIDATEATGATEATEAAGTKTALGTDDDVSPPEPTEVTRTASLTTSTATDASAVQDRGPTIAELLSRGRTLIADGDLIGARKLFEAAVEMDSPEAAFALARAYDAGFIKGVSQPNASADPEIARKWYEKWYELSVDQDLISPTINMDTLLRAYTSE